MCYLEGIFVTMRHLAQMFFSVSIFILFCAGNESIAQSNSTYFPNDTTVDYNVPNNAIIGFGSDSDYSSGRNGTSPTVNLVNSGSISGGLGAYNASTVNISGGSIGGVVSSNSASTINVSGGNIASIVSYSTSTINVTGGKISSELAVSAYSTINIAGGDINGFIFASNSGTFNFFGTGLGDTLVTPNYLNIYSIYSLYGTLSDGNSIDGKMLYVQLGSNAQVIFHNEVATPAPTALPIFAIGLAGISCGVWRKRRS